MRPHDLEVERYSPGQAQDAEGRQRGMVVQLARSIVVGPVARLELLPESATESADNVAPEALIEAHRDLDEEQSALVNARLVLLLANHVGDVDLLREAIRLAREDVVGG